MLNVIILNVVMLNVIKLGVVMMIADMLSVVAPIALALGTKKSIFKRFDISSYQRFNARFLCISALSVKIILAS